MRVLLMHRDHDFSLQRALPQHAEVLMQDLELGTLLRAMAENDEFLFDVARRALLSGAENDMPTILYRQEILKDCLRNQAVIRELYALAVEAREGRRKHWFGVYARYPGGILHGSIDVLRMYVRMLRRLREVAERNAGGFRSEGFTSLFAGLRKELTREYLARIEGHLTELKFRDGVLLSATLGEGGRAGANYILHQRGKGPSWLQRILRKGPPEYTFRLHERDQAGARILSELRDRGINVVANALGQSADHVLGFFDALRVELAFYIGCLNLHSRLVSKGEAVCFPRPACAGERRHRFAGLYDASLSLHMERRTVGNAADGDGKSLVIITGANQGGKSCFLRSIGLAQLMMQSGMFVAAESFAAELCTGLFTHYKREEDPTMTRGKLDEELARMSDIVDALAPDSLLLCNESFAATNEREGSEIATQIVRALLEGRVKVFFVTHLHEFARAFFDAKREDTLFLRAERRPDGTRSFKLVEGEPLETSFGSDLYRKIFGGPAAETRVEPISETPPVSHA